MTMPTQTRPPDEPSAPTPARTRPRLALGVLLAVLTGVALWLSGEQWVQAELGRVERDVQAGRIAAARSRLDWISALHLGGVEARYWRGACEEAEGKTDAALATWAAIRPGSARHANACIRRARLALEQGRFADAEDALASVEFPRTSLAFGMRESILQQLDLFTGRFEDLKRRIEIEWNGAANPAEILRKRYLVDNPRSFPIDALSARLEQAGKLAPEDDRVWLGQAVLATRTARFDQAEGWLRRCLERRPEDQEVCRARLDWAMAADRLGEAIAALRHISVNSMSPEERLAARSWLAGRIGDTQAEADALTRWVRRVPGELRALARLVAVKTRTGPASEAAELRRKKAELDRTSDAYRGALADHVPTEHFAELARQAESLGRWFEARGWWMLAQAESSDQTEARAALERLDRINRELEESDRVDRGSAGSTLADTMADILPKDVHDRAADTAVVIVPTFEDRAEAAGLRFTYENDPTPLSRLPESMGGGLALIDYDGDGWLDVYAVQGGKLPNESTLPPAPQGDRLFRNRRDGTFEDVTRAAGLLAFPGGYGHGAAVGDYDNDGHPDVLVLRWRSYALYRNRGDGTFEDATARAGLTGSRDWPASAAFVDLDGDGDLDLYVCHYADWDPQRSPLCPHPNDPKRYTYCGPRMFAATPDHVFRNDGGRFVDVSESSGVRAADRDGRGL
ncbi:MAG: FG-GAP-like repeat-containing protein, partial [Isosphaeraceae bacterium]